MSPRLEVELRYSGARLRLTLESLSLEGSWRVSGYTGTFRLTGDELEIKVSAGSLIKGIVGGAGRESVGIPLELLAQLTGKRVVLKGPLGVRLAEAKP
jgi:hypothetical protein